MRISSHCCCIAGLIALTMSLPGVSHSRVVESVSQTTDPARKGFPIYVMRHLDRMKGGDGLTEKGRQNACRLRRWFADKPLAAVYTSRFARAVDSAAPTATSRRIVVRRFNSTAALIAALPEAPGPILVVVNSFTVQQVVRAVGGTPPEKPPFNFGRIWTIARDGSTTVDQVPTIGPGCA